MNIRGKKNGFTMIELLAVVAIIAVLVIVLLVFLRNQNSRGHDARRKSDLERIRVSFEDYFNDNDCYPDSDILDICEDTSLQPYLNRIPCDPVSGDPYAYEPVAGCGGYRVYAILQVEDDPVIAKLGCDGEYGCGALAGPAYNYGISVGVPLEGEGYGIGTPTPTPSPIWVYACDSTGICNQFQEGHPLLSTCPITFQQSNCQNSCASQANRCTGF